MSFNVDFSSLCLTRSQHSHSSTLSNKQQFVTSACDFLRTRDPSSVDQFTAEVTLDLCLRLFSAKTELSKQLESYNQAPSLDKRKLLSGCMQFSSQEIRAIEQSSMLASISAPQECQTAVTCNLQALKLTILQAKMALLGKIQAEVQSDIRSLESFLNSLQQKLSYLKSHFNIEIARYSAETRSNIRKYERKKNNVLAQITTIDLESAQISLVHGPKNQTPQESRAITLKKQSLIDKRQELLNKLDKYDEKINKAKRELDTLPSFEEFSATIQSLESALNSTKLEFRSVKPAIILQKQKFITLSKDIKAPPSSEISSDSVDSSDPEDEEESQQNTIVCMLSLSDSTNELKRKLDNIEIHVKNAKALKVKMESFSKYLTIVAVV